MTPFLDIYDRFINKITDYNLIKLEEDEIVEICNKFLKSAITKFTDCYQDLSARDDDAGYFLIEITEVEQEILANLMIVEWLTPKIANTVNLNQFMGDKDFKFFSQANHLKELQSIKKNASEEADRLITKYSWNVKEIVEGLI